jgi:hypothetical protein
MRASVVQVVDDGLLVAFGTVKDRSRAEDPRSDRPARALELRRREDLLGVVARVVRGGDAEREVLRGINPPLLEPQ